MTQKKSKIQQQHAFHETEQNSHAWIKAVFASIDVLPFQGDKMYLDYLAIIGLPTCNIVSAKYVIMRCVLHMRKEARLCDEVDFKWLNLHQLK